MFWMQRTLVAAVATLVSRTVVIALLASGVGATPAFAQATRAPDPRADDLFRRAEAMEGQTTMSFPQHVRRTARLYLQSAELRAFSDPLRVESLSRAGGLLMAVDPPRSRKLLEQAGDLALANRAVFRAASLYTDAAWIVLRYPGTAEDLQAAVDCLELAERLIDSPVLTTQERLTIRQRIHDASEFIVAHRTRGT